MKVQYFPNSSHEENFPPRNLEELREWLRLVVHDVVFLMGFLLWLPFQLKVLAFATVKNLCEGE